MLPASLLVVAGVLGAARAFPPEPGEPACLRALTPVAQGAVADMTRFVAADCLIEQPAALRYDAAAGVARLTRALSPGDVVRRWPDGGSDAVLPGDALTIAVRSGAVRVQRRVTALQAARPGRDLFVRDSDGQVLSARLQQVAP